MNSNKAQVEIVGMLIVVILIVFVIFTVIRFQAENTPPQLSKSYMTEQMASSFLLAFLDTGTECVNHVSFREVIADCASGQEKLNCLNENSCDYLDDNLPILLENTLDKWGIKYRLNITHMNFEDKVHNTCDPLSDVEKHSFQLIPMWPNPNAVRVGIDICSY